MQRSSHPPAPIQCKSPVALSPRLTIMFTLANRLPRWHCLPALPSCSRLQIVFPGHGAYQKRHEAPFSKEESECSSARRSCQVEHRLHVRSTVRLVNSVVSSIFIFIPCSFPSLDHPGPLSPCLNGTAFLLLCAPALEDAVQFGSGLMTCTSITILLSFMYI
jgi:hypothetical protein